MISGGGTAGEVFDVRYGVGHQIRLDSHAKTSVTVCQQLVFDEQISFQSAIMIQFVVSFYLFLYSSFSNEPIFILIIFLFFYYLLFYIYLPHCSLCCGLWLNIAVSNDG